MKTGHDTVVPDSHLTIEQLTGHADNILSPEERDLVEVHLAECDECRSVAVNAAFFGAEEAGIDLEMEEPPLVEEVVVRTGAGRSRTLVLAAAATVALAIGGSTIWMLSARGLTRETEALILAAAVEPQRTLDGRLHGLKHRPAPPINRGAAVGELSPNVLVAAGELRKAAQGRGTAASAAALGLAFAMTDELDYAAASFEQAVSADPTNASYRNDLSAVYLARAIKREQSSDLVAAQAAADGALAVTPRLAEACFNRAFALERMSSPEAVGAWQQCLRIETDPEWRTEIDEHIDRLSGSAAAPKP